MPGRTHVPQGQSARFNGFVTSVHRQGSGQHTLCSTPPPAALIKWITDKDVGLDLQVGLCLQTDATIQ